MTAVKVGQIWQDKDKRRNTRIEIIAVGSGPFEGEATAIVVGTKTEKVYKVDRLAKRWEMIEEKAQEVSLPEAADKVRQGKAELALKAGDASWVVVVPERTRAKQATYMLKLVSPTEPDYKLRMTAKMIEEYGYPRDPWGNQMELA